MNWADYKGMRFDQTHLDANAVGTSYPMRNSTLEGCYQWEYIIKAT